MSNMIGKSGADWSKAPFGATHVREFLDGWYQVQGGNLFVLYSDSTRTSSSFNDVEDYNSSGGCKLISKEEDLGMDKKEVTKQVRSVDDLEVGMFLQGNNYKWVVLGVEDDSISLISPEDGDDTISYWPQTFIDDLSVFSNAFKAWSYTYNGEYTPIVKEIVETEAERKIKELEATIELAQKQLQEYRG